MAKDPKQAERVRVASDSTTSRAALADLAYDYPELRVAIASNPATYPGLLEWLSELGDSDVDAAIAARTDSSSTAQAAQATETESDQIVTIGDAPVASAPGSSVAELDDASLDERTILAPPAKPIAMASPETPSAPEPRTSRRLKTSLIAGAVGVVVVGLVLGGLTAYASFVQPHGSAAAVGEPSSATDYQFGAKETWKTKVDVVASPSDGSAGYYASVQTYPGLWLVSWPGDDSGSGRLTDETVLGVDPGTGAVKWSRSPGPYACAPSLAAGALACVDTENATLAILNPSTGKETDSSLNGVTANSVRSFKGDIVLGNESFSDTRTLDTIERVRLDGTVDWEKSKSCSSPPSDDGMQISTFDELHGAAIGFTGPTADDAFFEGVCFTGGIDLDSGVINPKVHEVDSGCLQYSPFEDSEGLFPYGDPCVSKTYPMLITRGESTLTAITMHAYLTGGDEADFPTVWSAELSGAMLSNGGDSQRAIVHLGSYALLVSAGHLYGIDTEHGPTWEQSDEFSGNGQVVLLPIDANKPNTPVLALDSNDDTITRLDPGYGAARVSAEPAALPSCPQGETPVSFTSWDNGKGATLVCGGFSQTVTVYLTVDDQTYTSSNGSITPTGYFADFGGGTSVAIGLGGWAAWVTEGSTTTLHAASSGWQVGDVHPRNFPKLTDDVESCPVGTYALSLSTWDGGWLLTCGKNATVVTKFLFVNGSVHGSGNSMPVMAGQSCGTSSNGVRICVSASPAVVTFTSNGGSQKQHSVDTNYVVGKGFGGAGQGTGAYGLSDPKADAASEVAYLNGILEQSQAARSSVRTVVQDILGCTSEQADVQSAQDVAADRSTELEALGSAPVDAVPGGSALVAQLHAVLQDSLTADQAYVTAASQIADGDCSSGRSTYDAQKPLIAQITSEKTAFANTWNGQIAPQFGTPTYTQDDI